MEEALESLSAQGLNDDLEIIVQDGDVEPDRGQSDALNKGFSKAHGEWFFGLNADDVLLPGALGKVKRLICDGGECVEWIAGNQLLIDSSRRIVRCSVGNVWHDFLYRHSVPHVYGPSSFFRSELFHRVGGMDVSLDFCMDWDLWIKFAKAGARYRRIDAYLWAQRQWSGSKTQRRLSEEDAACHQKEVKKMLTDNGFSVTAAGVWLMRLWRAVNGNYFTEWRDGVRMRGHGLSIAGDVSCEMGR